jgi:hypothetical protein
MFLFVALATLFPTTIAVAQTCTENQDAVGRNILAQGPLQIQTKDEETLYVIDNLTMIPASTLSYRFKPLIEGGQYRVLISSGAPNEKEAYMAGKLEKRIGGYFLSIARASVLSMDPCQIDILDMYNQQVVHIHIQRVTGHQP